MSSYEVGMCRDFWMSCQLPKTTLSWGANLLIHQRLFKVIYKQKIRQINGWRIYRRSKRGEKLVNYKQWKWERCLASFYGHSLGISRFQVEMTPTVSSIMAKKRFHHVCFDDWAPLADKFLQIWLTFHTSIQQTALRKFRDSQKQSRALTWVLI